METLRYKNVSEGEYLAVLSIKHSIDPDRLFQALTSIKEQQKVMCDSLSIECRGRSRGGRIFLIMDHSKVVAQVIISEGFLSEKNNPITKFKDCDRIRSYLAKKAACTFKHFAISDLVVGMNSINLSAKVLELHESKSIQTSFGNHRVFAYALIGDNTGTVKLSLWGEQIGSVSVGDSIQIINARMRAVRGEKQLQIGRNGVLKVDAGFHSIQS